MPLLHGNPSQGGYGGIKPRIGNQANRWQEQIKRNPGWQNWKPPVPEREQPGGPKLGTPPQEQPQGQPQGQSEMRPEFGAIREMMKARMDTGGFGGPGGFMGAFKSEAIPMSVTGIPGSNQGISRGVLDYLPEQLRKMMGV